MDQAHLMRILNEVDQCSANSPIRPFVDVRALPISDVCSDQRLRENLKVLQSEGHIELKELSDNGLAVKLKGKLAGQPNTLERHSLECAQLPVTPNAIELTEQFWNVISADIPDETSVRSLIANIFHNPDVTFYYFEAEGSTNPFLDVAVDRGDLIRRVAEKFYYSSPDAPRDFWHIPAARYGDYRWDWQKDVVERGPEYWRTKLQLSERKRRELESWERIYFEEQYRDQFRQASNTFGVFLSYSTSDKQLAERLYNALTDAGVRTFLACKSLSPGEDFADRIRDTLAVAGEVWILVMPASIQRP